VCRLALRRAAAVRVDGMLTNHPVLMSRRRALCVLGVLGAEVALATSLQPVVLAQPQPAALPPFVGWHDRTQAQHLALRDQYVAQGFRFLSLSIYGATSAPYYAAVMIQPKTPTTQHDYAGLSAAQWQAAFDAEAAQGYGPIILTATGPASGPLFAAVFEPQSPIPLTRHGLNATAGDPNSIQSLNAQAKSQNLILRWAASYGDAAAPAFAGIWVPNTANTQWGNDSGSYNAGGQTVLSGLLDNVASYQARFDAQTSVWSRPHFVTLNASSQYLSVFVDSWLAGGYQARHDMSSADYQSAFDTWTQQGYLPVCVQAAGSDLGSARFSAIFAPTRDTVDKTFTASGPVTNDKIDTAVRQAMHQYGVPTRRWASCTARNSSTRGATRWPNRAGRPPSRPPASAWRACPRRPPPWPSSN